MDRAWQKLFIKHAGKYVALSGDANSVDLQTFEGMSKSEVQLHAAANGVTAPIIFYCPPLKPWLQPDIDELSQIQVKLDLFAKNTRHSSGGPTWAFHYLATAVDALKEFQALLKQHTRTVEQQCLLQEIRESNACEAKCLERVDCADAACRGHCPNCQSNQIGGGGCNGMFCANCNYCWNTNSEDSRENA